MAIIERDVVLMGKSGDDQTIDLPVTRLGNIEDGASVKTTLADTDALPVIDSKAAGEMKKITWAHFWDSLLSKVKKLFYTKTEVESQMENKANLAGRIQLTSGKDLNTVTTYGNYASSSSSLTNTLINKPSDLYGYFELDATSSDGVASSGYIRQTIRASAPYYAGKQWMRTFAPSEGWSTWREIPTIESGTLTLVNGWQARNGYTSTVTLVGKTVSVNALIHGGVNSGLTQMAQVGDSTFYPPETRFVECGNGSAVYITPTGKIDIGVPFKEDITSCRLCLSYIL